MATYYVATNGSNSNNGSISAPWQTINYAAAAARNLQPGDTVIVKAGTYNISSMITIGASGSAAGGKITFKSEVKGGAKIVSSTSTAFNAFNKHHVRIEGFDISGCTGGAIVFNTSYDFDIVDNIIHHNGKQGIYCGRGCEFILIEGNDVHHCADDGSAINSISIQLMQMSSGSAVRSGYRLIVRGNIVHENGLNASSTDSAGIMLDQDETNQAVTWTPVPYNFPRLVENNICYTNAGSGIVALATTIELDALIRNNTCYHNGHKLTAGGMVSNLLCRASGTKWVNNIAISDKVYNDNVKAISVCSLPRKPIVYENIEWHNNITWNGVDNNTSLFSNTGNSGNLPQNNVNGNKLGVNPNINTTDFKLALGSPAIDAGTTSVGGALTTDFYKATRTGTVDIGAVEYTGGTGTMSPNSLVATGAFIRGTTTDIIANVALGGNFVDRNSRNSPAPACWIGDTANTRVDAFPSVTKNLPANTGGSVVFVFSMKPKV